MTLDLSTSSSSSPEPAPFSRCTGAKCNQGVDPTIRPGGDPCGGLRPERLVRRSWYSGTARGGDRVNI